MRILSTLNRELLKPSASVALHRHSNALVDILPPEADSSISLLDQSERPDVSYSVQPPTLTQFRHRQLWHSSLELRFYVSAVVKLKLRGFTDYVRD